LRTIRMKVAWIEGQVQPDGDQQKIRTSPHDRWLKVETAPLAGYIARLWRMAKSLESEEGREKWWEANLALEQPDYGKGEMPLTPANWRQTMTKTALREHFIPPPEHAWQRRPKRACEKVCAAVIDAFAIRVQAQALAA
jgi:hypothetical protein